MITIAELPEYLRHASSLLFETQRQEIVEYLAAHPKSGVIMKNTGGIRKLRWSRPGMGKSGGVRIIYYYHNDQMPLYLLTIFGKGEKDNLSKAQRDTLAKLVKVLVASWRKHYE